MGRANCRVGGVIHKWAESTVGIEYPVIRTSVSYGNSCQTYAMGLRILNNINNINNYHLQLLINITNNYASYLRSSCIIV